MIIAAVGIAIASYLWGGAGAPVAEQQKMQVREDVQLAYDVAKYWVYCIDDEISVEMWDLEQMKVRRGEDVCQLYENTSMSSAQDWAKKNFPDGKCFCDN